MNKLTITDIPRCVDPERCAECPPDKICAWACEQGWGMHEISIQRQLIAEGVIEPYPDPREALSEMHQSMLGVYN